MSVFLIMAAVGVACGTIAAAVGTVCEAFRAFTAEDAAMKTAAIFFALGVTGVMGAALLFSLRALI